MPLSRFLRQCLETVEKWSKQYANSDKVFILTPTIELKQWTKAYRWAKGNKAVTSKIVEDKTECYCLSKNEIRAKDEDIKQVKGMIWNTFEQFKKSASAIWIVTLSNHENMADNWKQGKCTIPYFLKKIHVYTFGWLSNSVKICKATTSSKRYTNWAKALTRKTKKIIESTYC
jgi:hypothetical protein